MDHRITAGTVYFIGAGPGAPDLITVRGRAIIEQADLVLYADSLVQASVAGLARKPTARIVGSAELHLAQLVALMVEAAQVGQVVARVHTGDPALYGAIHEQMAALDEHGIPYAIVPGVTAAFAAAARLAVELTVPELTQTVILGRVAGRTPVPEREALPALAAHGASLALYLSVDQIERVVAELLAGGAYTPATPVAVVYRATWPDEQVISGTLADIAAAVRAAGHTRHALILVGPALRPGRAAAPSRLYDANFGHGYRGVELASPYPPTPAPTQAAGGREGEGHPPLFIAVTRAGAALAARLAHELGGAALLPARFAAGATGALTYEGPVAEAIRQHWAAGRPLVLIMAAGVAVRALAPLLGHKASDPAIVCLDEAGRSVIPLLGGHRAGANELARRIAVHTGGHAAVTTASDTQGLPALDLLGRDADWQIDPDSALTHAMGCLVNGEPIGCYVDPALPAQRRQLEQWLAACPDLTFVEQPEELLAERYHAALLVTHRALKVLWPALRAKTVRYSLPLLVVGLGCRRGVPAEELHAALDVTLDEAGLNGTCIAALATVDLKAEEPGLAILAEVLGVPLEAVPSARLSTLDPAAFSPSAASTHLDLPGVAEPCAVLVAGGPLLVPKRAFARCTVAVALRTTTAAANTAPGQLTLLSLGPGDPRQLTLAADAALRAAEVVVGYQGYIDAIRDQLAPGQQVIASGMQTELERAQQALEQAAAGRRVALVSSGDIGVYAMAGPVFELLAARGWSGASPAVSVLPGISAVQALAARLGAAINHDFCVISLSDLLTPWELIERRLAAAAAGDFVVALYNPRSRERHWQLSAALAILRAHRPPTTPLAFGRNVMRPDERIVLTTLAEADPAQADMFTVVLIGNSRSYLLGERLVTPRGYVDAARRGDGEAVRRRSQIVASSRPRVPASSRRRVVASSRRRVVASSPPRIIASPSHRVIASSRRRVVASSPPRIIASPSHRVIASSRRRVVASSPPRIIASSPRCRQAEARFGPTGLRRAPCLLASSRPRVVASSRPRVPASSRRRVVASPRPRVLASSPPADYPVVLTRLDGALAVVVGGGAVGERKVRGLLAVGAEVRLVSPGATPQLRTWANEQRISWMQRDYATGDLAGAQLVFAATNQRAVNARVAREAAELRMLCNVADAPDEGNFHLPALHRGPDVTIAVSSGGAAPARAAALRDAIARWLQSGATEEQHER